MKIPKQKMFILRVHHSNTWWGAFKWWINGRNKHCKRFCPNCEYFFKCQEDIALLELNGENPREIFFPVAMGILAGISLVAIALISSIIILNMFI